MEKEKDIIISEKNTEKITAMIKEEEGRSRERTITARDVFDAVERMEQRRKDLKVSKAALELTTVWCDPNAQNFPNAYKYRPYSTQFLIIFAKGKYRLCHVKRLECCRYGRWYDIDWSDTAKEQILEGARWM